LFGELKVRAAGLQVFKVKTGIAGPLENEGGVQRGKEEGAGQGMADSGGVEFNGWDEHVGKAKGSRCCAWGKPAVRRRERRERPRDFKWGTVGKKKKRGLCRGKQLKNRGESKRNGGALTPGIGERQSKRTCNQ